MATARARDPPATPHAPPPPKAFPPPGLAHVRSACHRTLATCACGGRQVFNFADYTHEEMAGIVRSVAIERGFMLDERLTDDNLVPLVQRMVKAGEIAKGNGRLARNIIEAAIARQTNRVFALGTVTKGTLTTLMEEDFGEADASSQGLESVPEVVAKLDSIVGLASVKVFVKQLMAQLTMRAQRLEAGLPVPGDSSLHMIFSGNPGTGKTYTTHTHTHTHTHTRRARELASCRPSCALPRRSRHVRAVAQDGGADCRTSLQVAWDPAAGSSGRVRPCRARGGLRGADGHQDQAARRDCPRWHSLC
jgi:hypothetical protein